MKGRKSPSLWTVTALVLVLSLVLPWAVLADNTVPDGDGTTPIDANPLKLGDVCLGSKVYDTVLVAISRNGNYGSTNVFKKSSTADVTILSVLGSGLSATVTSPVTIAIPSNWDTVPNNTMSPAVTSNVAFIPQVLGDFSGSITYRSTGTSSKDDSTLRRDQAMAVTANVLSCNTAPSITVNDVTKEGNTIGGWTLVFGEIGSASDTEDGTPVVACTPAIGSVLPLGSTVVACTATDSGGLTENGSGTVTVVDTTPPTLHNVPADMTVEGNTTGGANVAWTNPTATDIVDANPTVGCSPSSGSFFALGGPHAITCTAIDASSNLSSASFNATVVDTTPPNITCPADFNGTVGQPVSLGTPTVSDIVDASPTMSNDAPGSFPPGSTFVHWTATDHSGNPASCTQKVTLLYNWAGFFHPVDNNALNVVKAGSAVPVKFSLGGDQELGIFMSGYPKSYQIACDTLLPQDNIEETVTAGQSSLTYDPVAGQYIYVWKTVKTWLAGTCRRLDVLLIDGTHHSADFRFK